MSKTNAAGRPMGWSEALRLMLDQAAPGAVVEWPLLQAAGFFCAARLSSAYAVPPFDNSSMDGYAVHAEDLGGAAYDEPVVLRLVGEIAAGSSTRMVVGRGEAAAIMTGAPMPDGANAVVKVESTRREDGVVHVLGPVAPGACVRRAGADTALGSAVLAKGDLIGPGAVGLLASCGISRVPVYRKPRVALCTSGDEVVTPGETEILQPGQIFDSNSSMLQALIRTWGYEVDFLGRMPDEENAILRMLRVGSDYDYLVTVGGVSMGRHDYLRPCLDALGAEEIFWKVNQQPGGPMLYARLGSTHVLGLPGNPVSCYVCADIYLRAALRAASGSRAVWPKCIPAKLSEPLQKPHGKVAFIRGKFHEQDGELLVSSTGVQDSNRVRSIVDHDGYIIFPEESRYLGAGTSVQVLLATALP